MGYMEDIKNLRVKFQEAISKGVFEDATSFEVVLVQIMNEAEKNRQLYVNKAEEFRRQAISMDGNAQAFSSLSSIINSVINGFMLAAEKERRDREALAAEQAEKEQYMASLAAQQIVAEDDDAKSKRKPKK